VTDEERARTWLREYRHDTCDGNHKDDLPALTALIAEVRAEGRDAALAAAASLARSLVTPLCDGGGYPAHEAASETAEELARRIEELRG